MSQTRRSFISFISALPFIPKSTKIIGPQFVDGLPVIEYDNKGKIINWEFLKQFQQKTDTLESYKEFYLFIYGKEPLNWWESYKNIEYIKAYTHKPVFAVGLPYSGPVMMHMPGGLHNYWDIIPSHKMCLFHLVISSMNTINYAGQGYIYSCPHCWDSNRSPTFPITCKKCGEHLDAVEVFEMDDELYEVIMDINELETGTIFGMSVEQIRNSDMGKACAAIGVDLAEVLGYD